MQSACKLAASWPLRSVTAFLLTPAQSSLSTVRVTLFELTREVLSSYLIKKIKEEKGEEEGDAGVT